MTDQLSEIEQLLEKLGSNETPGDTRHRYALRRALLRSRRFSANRVTLRLVQFFAVSGSVLAGGLMAVVVISVVTTRTVRPGSVATSSATSVSSVPIEVADAQRSSLTLPLEQLDLPHRASVIAARFTVRPDYAVAGD